MSKYDADANIAMLCGLAGVKPIPAGGAAPSPEYGVPDYNGGVLTEVTEAIRAEHKADLDWLDIHVPSPNGAPWPGDRIYSAHTLDTVPGLTPRQSRNLAYNYGYTGAPYVVWNAYDGDNSGNYEIIPGAFNCKNWDTLEADYRAVVENRLRDLRLAPPRPKG